MYVGICIFKITANFGGNFSETLSLIHDNKEILLNVQLNLIY